MNKVQKSLRIVIFSTITVAVLMLLGFVMKQKANATCEGLVVIFQSDHLRFVEEQTIRQLIAEVEQPLVGEPFEDIDLKKIEKAVLEIPYLNRVKVFRTVDSHLVVEVTERTPIVRLIDRRSRHAMIDRDGFLMPVPGASSPRIPIVSLDFDLVDAEIKSCKNVCNSDTLTHLLSVYQYVNLLESDPFLNAQFQHTLLKANGEFVVYPLVGNHTVSIGTLEDIDEKIAKLKLFYSDGMNAVNWNKFADINLKYKDQIVCTKK